MAYSAGLPGSKYIYLPCVACCKPDTTGFIRNEITGPLSVIGGGSSPGQLRAQNGLDLNDVRNDPRLAGLNMPNLWNKIHGHCCDKKHGTGGWQKRSSAGGREDLNGA